MAGNASWQNHFLSFIKIFKNLSKIVVQIARGSNCFSPVCNEITFTVLHMVKFGYYSGECISILQSKAFNFCTFLSLFIESLLSAVLAGIKSTSLAA